MKWLLVTTLLVGYVYSLNQLANQANLLARSLSSAYSIVADQPVQLLERAEQLSKN